MKYAIRFSLILFLFTLIAQPYSYAKSTFPPPVEKVKPPVEKKKIKKRAKMKLRKKRQKLKQQKQQNNALSIFVTVLILLFILAAILGTIFFGLGVVQLLSTFWIMGLVMMGSANLVGLIGVILLCYEALDHQFLSVFLLLVFLILNNLIAGLIFFIGGLIAMNPLTWVVGIALILLVIIFIWLFLVSVNNSSIN